MALTTGVAVDCSGAVGYCDHAEEGYASDLTDVESDEDYSCSPEVFEHGVARGSKRTCGVFVDSEAVPSRRLRSRIDWQFDVLMTIAPNLCTDVKASILTCANEYIEKLLRQVQELQYDLVYESSFESNFSCCEDDQSSCECDTSLHCTEERAVDSNVSLESICLSNCDCSQPTVEVVRTEQGLNIHIECVKRPGLLVDIMELLESSGLNVEQASIICQEHLIFDGLGSEVEDNDAGVCRHVSCVSAEDVGASLRSLIVDHRPAFLTQ